MIDVSAGDKIPRKGGPGITKSDLLVINKVDIAPLVGASLDVMERDAKKMRGLRPFVFSNMKSGQGIEDILAFIIDRGMLKPKSSSLQEERSNETVAVKFGTSTNRFRTPGPSACRLGCFTHA